MPLDVRTAARIGDARTEKHQRDAVEISVRPLASVGPVLRDGARDQTSLFPVDGLDFCVVNE